MKNLMNPRLALTGMALAVAVLAGCGSQPTTPAAAAAAAPSMTPAAAEKIMYFAVLPEDERHYLFSNKETYLSYLRHGEVALTRTRIGASPAGTTVVFGITEADVKAKRPTVAEQLFDGKLTAGAGFYGEVFKDGRYYVFHDLNDMKAYLEHGEAALTFTDIGTGPDGATQIWVMNKTSMKQGRPTETMANFKAIRAAK